MPGDLFGVAGRQLLDRLELPSPWRGTVDAGLALIGDLERQINQINRELRAGGAGHPSVPLLLSVPGIGWVLAFTIAAEIGDIERFATAKKLVGHTGPCPKVKRSVTAAVAARCPSTERDHYRSDRRLSRARACAAVRNSSSIRRRP